MATTLQGIGMAANEGGGSEPSWAQKTRGSTAQGVDASPGGDHSRQRTAHAAPAFGKQRWQDLPKEQQEVALQKFRQLDLSLARGQEAVLDTELLKVIRSGADVAPALAETLAATTAGVSVTAEEDEKEYAWITLRVADVGSGGISQRLDEALDRRSASRKLPWRVLKTSALTPQQTKKRRAAMRAANLEVNSLLFAQLGDSKCNCTELRDVLHKATVLNGLEEESITLRVNRGRLLAAVPNESKSFVTQGGFHVTVRRQPNIWDKVAVTIAEVPIELSRAHVLAVVMQLVGSGVQTGTTISLAEGRQQSSLATDLASLGISMQGTDSLEATSAGRTRSWTVSLRRDLAELLPPRVALQSHSSHKVPDCCIYLTGGPVFGCRRCGAAHNRQQPCRVKPSAPAVQLPHPLRAVPVEAAATAATAAAAAAATAAAAAATATAPAAAPHAATEPTPTPAAASDVGVAVAPTAAAAASSPSCALNLAAPARTTAGGSSSQSKTSSARRRGRRLHQLRARDGTVESEAEDAQRSKQRKRRHGDSAGSSSSSRVAQSQRVLSVGAAGIAGICSSSLARRH